MANADRTMADFRIANGLLARANTVEEVLHVIVADVETLSAYRERCSEQVWIARFDFAASDKDPPSIAFKFHAVLLTIFIDHGAIPGIGFCALANQVHTIGIFI